MTRVPTLARRAVGGIVALVAAATLVAGSRVRMPGHPREDAMLRLAWSARPERIERCRAPSAGELAAVAAHMRAPLVCEGFAASYRLEVRRDGHLLDSAVLRGGGLRHDRQLYAFRERPIPAGRSTIEVRLTRRETPPRASAVAAVNAPVYAPAGTPASPEPTRRALDERARRVADEVPSSLVLHETITVAPREVVLVTYDRTSRRLRLVRRPSLPAPDAADPHAGRSQR